MPLAHPQSLDRGGGIEQLAELGQQFDFTAESIGRVEVDGVLVSSTRIRTLIKEGAVYEASRLLGRYYRMKGEVVRGQQRGREIGVPTANLAPSDRLYPSNGVYAGRVWYRFQPYPAVINIGHKPTFGERQLSVEAHILDWKAPPLYGEHVSFEFHRRLRDERRFPSVRALVDQIHRDIDDAREILGTA